MAAVLVDKLPRDGLLHDLLHLESRGSWKGRPKCDLGCSHPRGLCRPSGPSQAVQGVLITAFPPNPAHRVFSKSEDRGLSELHTSHLTELFFQVLCMGWGGSFQVSHEMSSPSWTPLSETALPPPPKTLSTSRYSSLRILNTIPVLGISYCLPALGYKFPGGRASSALVTVVCKETRTVPGA